MELIGEDRNGTQVISVRDKRIDSAVAIQFKDSMRELTSTSAGPVVLDLTLVGFMDSSGLGALVAILKYLGADRKLTLVGLSPTVEKVFQLTRMDKIFTVYSNLEEALEAPSPTA